MKYIKSFEDLQFEPQVDDYVLVNINLSRALLDNNIEIMQFVNNTIGQISKIREDTIDYVGNKDKGDIIVVYDNVPEEIKDWFTFTRYDNENSKYNGLYRRTFAANKIVVFGKTEEEVKQKVLKDKFNI